MRKYVKNMIDGFPINIEKSQEVTIKAAKNVFKVDRSKHLNKNKLEFFHTTVSRNMFLCKRSRLGIQPNVAFYALE